MKNEIEKHIKEMTKEIQNLELALEDKESRISALRTPRDICEEYIHLTTQTLSNKERKKAPRRIAAIEEDHRYIKDDVDLLTWIENAKQDITCKKSSLSNVENYIGDQVERVVRVLEERGFVQYVDDIHIVTSKGMLSTHIQEIPGHIFSELMIKYNFFEKQTAEVIAGIFSCFTNITTSDAQNSVNHECLSIMNDLRSITNEFYDIENANEIDISDNYDFHTNIVNEVIDWCGAADITECRIVIESINANKGISLGDFIKAILKINNVATELMKLNTLPVSLRHKLVSIRDMTQKYVVTNQSLYI